VRALVLSISFALVACACGGKGPDSRQYTLQGQIVSINPDRKVATIKHEEIKGFMPAMTMPYTMKDSKVLDGIAPGDLITGTLIVLPSDAIVTELRKVGQAPLEQPAKEDAPPASSGFELLKPGDTVPDATFLDQDGRKRRFASFRGSTLLVTFIYTRCPMPTFCPLMDQHFAAIQKRLHDVPGRVHLVSVSVDPLADTPAVLKKHATELGADPRTWTFLTGDRDEIDRFGARFGVSVVRELDDQRTITHNLRTAIVDASGKLVKVYTGNEWTPDRALADLEKGVVPLF